MATTFDITYAGKVSGSTTANPHRAQRALVLSKMAPEGFSYEFINPEYTKIIAKDGNVQSSSFTDANRFVQELYEINIVEAIERKFGTGVWAGATTLAQKVAKAKELVTSLSATFSGYGTHPTGNKATMHFYRVGAANPILASDTFNRANNATLGNAETGQAWETYQVGNTSTPTVYGIVSNTLKATTQGNLNSIAIVESGKSNVEVKVTFPTLRSTGDGIVVRANGAGNFIVWVQDQVRIYTNNVWVDTPLTGIPKFVANTPYSVKAEGTTITLYKNGVYVNSFTTATHQTNTRHGVQSSLGGMSADNFTITDLAPTESYDWDNYTVSHSNATVTDLNLTADNTNFQNVLLDNGFVYYCATSEPANGTQPTVLNTDSFKIALTVNADVPASNFTAHATEAIIQPSNAGTSRYTMVPNHFTVTASEAITRPTDAGKEVYTVVPNVFTAAASNTIAFSDTAASGFTLVPNHFEQSINNAFAFTESSEEQYTEVPNNFTQSATEAFDFVEIANQEFSKHFTATATQNFATTDAASQVYTVDDTEFTAAAANTIDFVESASQNYVAAEIGQHVQTATETINLVVEATSVYTVSISHFEQSISESFAFVEDGTQETAFQFEANASEAYVFTEEALQGYGLSGNAFDQSAVEFFVFNTIIEQENESPQSFTGLASETFSLNENTSISFMGQNTAKAMENFNFALDIETQYTQGKNDFTAKAINTFKMTEAGGQQYTSSNLNFRELHVPALYIFDRDEKLVSVFSNRDKGACPIISAEMTEELNGPVTLEFEIPADHNDSQYLQEDYIVAVKDKEKAWQLFYIRELEDVHGSEWTKRAYCEHSIVDLQDNMITNLFVDRKNAAFALGQILNGTRWQVGAVNTHSNVHDITVKYESAMEAFTTFIARWGIEVKYRVTIAGQAITGRYIDIYTTRGADTGKRFEYNKDMSEIIRTVDTSQIKTGLYGLGKDDELGNPLLFDSINGGFPYVVDEAARMMWGRPTGGIRKHRWGVYRNSDIEVDKALLKAQTEAALQIVKNPIVEYQMKVQDITTAIQVPHEAVTLGMTVGAIDRDLKLQLKARCIRQKIDLLNEDFTEITLGNFIPTQSQTMNNVESKLDDLANNVINKGDAISTDWLEGDINALQNQIMAGTGTVTLTENNGIMVENAEKTKAIRLLGGILAIANSRVNGVYNWRTFGTGDGFVADQITAGFMKFDRSRGGTLLLGGNDNGNGNLIVYSESGEVVADLDAQKGGFSDLYVGKFRSDTVLNSNSDTIVYIVNPATGNDNNSGLSSNTALKHLQVAIDRIPKHNNGRVEIYIAKAVFNEHEINIDGFFGSGTIAIYFQQAQLNGMMYLTNNVQRIELRGGFVNQVYGTQYLRDGTVTLKNSRFVYMNDMNIYSRRNVDFGVRVQSSNLEVTDCSFYDPTTAAINAELGGTVDITGNCEGSGGFAGVRAIGTGRIAVHNVSVPAGTVGVEAVLGGVVGGTISSHQAGTPLVLEGPPITNIFKPTGTRSWNTKKGWITANNYIYQGEWSEMVGETPTYYGNYKGCVWFDGSAINTAIQGKTVLSARLRLKRLSYGGNNGDFVANLWALTSSINQAGVTEPVIDANIGGGTTFLWGEEDYIAIPIWCITALANGSYTGFCLHYPDGTRYSIYEDDASLEIVYK